MRIQRSSGRLPAPIPSDAPQDTGNSGYSFVSWSGSSSTCGLGHRHIPAPTYPAGGQRMHPAAAL